MLAEAVATQSRPALRSPAPDELLIARFKAGDQTAFDVLYLRYRDRLRSVMGRFTPEWADAEDLVQEAMLKAMRALPGYRGDSQFFTWLYRIAINTGINFTQRQKWEYSNCDVPDAATDIGPERLRMLAEQQRSVTQALDQLSPSSCQALLLNVVQDLDYEEVSDVMDCPVGTTRSRISRARERLVETTGVAG